MKFRVYYKLPAYDWIEVDAGDEAEAKRVADETLAEDATQLDDFEVSFDDEPEQVWAIPRSLVSSEPES